MRARNKKKLQRPRLSLGILLADNFTLSTFALFTDLMRLAADEGDLSRPLDVSWSVMSPGTRPKRSSCGVMVNRTSPLVDPKQFDYVIVVGGLLHAGPQIDAETGNYLRKAARLGVPLIGMCTGSFILTRLGLMRNRCACVSWYHHQDFIDEFPGQAVVADRIYLLDRDRITLPGGASTADFAMHLIERHLGHVLAQKAQEVLQFDRMRLGSETPPHPPVAMNVINPTVRRALLLMEQNLSRPLTNIELARELGLSSRHFERLFRRSLGQPPAHVYREVRMRYAAWLVKHSRQSITRIALSAGFSDCAHFSRQFRAVHGVPPSRLREPSPADGRSQRAASRIFQ